MKIVMNQTVKTMDNWMTIVKQIKKEALVLAAQTLLTSTGLIH
jgi:hypothetical protein